jgi:hypothetical protein
VAEGELRQGGEFIRGPNSSSGEAEKSLEGWTWHRARWRIVPEGRSALLVILDVLSRDGRWRAESRLEGGE